ncbi:MAG: DUF3592 domain-containing protein, partial [Pirellulales bacterium]
MARFNSDDAIFGVSSPVVAFALFAVVSLAVGIGMFTVRHYALSETEAARDWVETPCVVEESKFARSDNRNAADGRPTLDLVYRYEFAGQTYRGDRLDLLIGSMGDDEAWERRLFERFPPGARTVCYVDPNDPANSVLDRDNAATKSRNLWLLSFPFLCVGCGFTLALVTSLVDSAVKPAADAA